MANDATRAPRTLMTAGETLPFCLSSPGTRNLRTGAFRLTGSDEVGLTVEQSGSLAVTSRRLRSNLVAAGLTDTENDSQGPEVRGNVG